MTIAIDGPVGAGKSTIAQGVADALGGLGQHALRGIYARHPRPEPEERSCRRPSAARDIEYPLAPAG